MGSKVKTTPINFFHRNTKKTWYATIKEREEVRLIAEILLSRQRATTAD